jgi:uncharacterized protein (TIGR00251 family)
VSEVRLVERVGGVGITVRVQPKASRTALDGVADGVLRVRVAAPPVDGAANEALCRFLAREVLGVAPGRVSVGRGASGRDKVVVVAGLSVDEVRAALVRASG